MAFSHIFVAPHTIQVARSDMLLACRRSLVHGPLLLLRYTLSGLPWGLLVASTHWQQAGEGPVVSSPSMRIGLWIDRLLGLLEEVWVIFILLNTHLLDVLTSAVHSFQVADLAMPVLAHPVEGVSAEDVDPMDEDGGEGQEDDDEAGGDAEGSLGPGAQVCGD